jgi:uncharacterized membrane protein
MSGFTSGSEAAATAECCARSFRVEVEESMMKTATLAGLILIVLGIVSLAYQGFTYTTQKRVVEIGSLHATKNENHRVPLPPVLGGLLLAGGVLLLITGSRASVS